MEDSSSPSPDPTGARSPLRRAGRRGESLERVPIAGKGASRGPTLESTPAGERPKAPTLPRDADPLGKMALYSGEQPRRPFGTFVLECSSCKRETPVSGIGVIRSALPFSLHLPLVRRFSSYMRCPACGRRTWLRVTWRP